MSEEGSPDRSNNQMGLKGLLVFIIIIAITVIIVFASYSAYVDYAGDEVPVLNVKVKLSDGEDDPVFDRWITEVQSYAPYIENISSDMIIEQFMVDALEAPGDASLQLADRPAVVIYAFNMDDSWKTGKASVKYTGPGEYTFNISFPDAPEPGDSIRVVVEVVYDKVIYPNEDIYPLYTADRYGIFYLWQ
ncbi:MAG: hypothetical protein KAS67_05790 [Thermoplasmata archaeon]|nr:hypothetical protein [Thermoplasmata archaeon]